MSTGISDVANAELDILRRAEAKKNGNVMENYYAFLQEMPLKPEDAFTKSGSSPFDLGKINFQVANINTNRSMQLVQRGRLDWPKISGKRQFGGKPIWYMDDGSIDKENPDKNKFPFEIVEHPVDGYKNIHVAAVDPYHIDDEFENIKDLDVWDVIVLTPRGNTVKDNTIPNFKRIVNNQTTTGYIIKTRMLPILINILNESKQLQIKGVHKDISSIDQYWKQMQLHYSFYYYKNIFAGQLVGYSNIEKRYVDYNDRFIKQNLF
jgi:hypothetical protein